MMVMPSYPLRKPQRGVAALVMIPVLLWSSAVGALWWKQESLLFAPQALPNEVQMVLPDVREEWVDVPGARLHALHLRQPVVAGQRSTKGIVFYLHGNGGNVATWLTNPSFWRASGYDLFLIDYRGYGKSTGQIVDEAQMHDDLLRAWHQVAPEYEGLKHVIYGRSLGTGLATKLATQVQPDLLVLVSPYYSMKDVATEHYPWVPGFILRYPLPTYTWLPQVKGQVFIVHGEQDTLIPFAHAQRLLALKPDAELLPLPQAAHNDIQRFDVYTDALMAHLKALAGH